MKCSTLMPLSIVLIVGLLVPQATAQTAAASTEPAARSDELVDRKLPIDSTESMPVDQLLGLIHEKIPQFNAVVVRAQGVEPNFPTLPKMTLNNVTIGQLMELIGTSFPDTQVRTVDGPGAPLWVVDVHHMAGEPNSSTLGQPQAPPPVQVVNLSDIVSALAAPGKDGQKQAMNDVLSLIQAAMKVVGGDAPVLQVHEPTQSLVFKGTPQQSEVLGEMLQTLRPSQDQRVKAAQEEAKRDSDRWMQERATMEATIEATRRRLDEEMLNNSRLRQRVQELEDRVTREAATQPAR